ncbi:hypothetical protein [Risungbinella massiliensis]|uniref:hypothetical protein n=1 Tax=Risungbinella massiliensis TaxID=1329796 RepID=UPI0005CC1056|nr:hypothetical protein [Risungbinella massiliensis]
MMINHMNVAIVHFVAGIIGLILFMMEPFSFGSVIGSLLPTILNWSLAVMNLVLYRIRKKAQS